MAATYNSGQFATTSLKAGPSLLYNNLTVAGARGSQRCVYASQGEVREAGCGAQAPRRSERARAGAPLPLFAFPRIARSRAARP